MKSLLLSGLTVFLVMACGSLAHAQKGIQKGMCTQKGGICMGGYGGMMGGMMGGGMMGGGHGALYMGAQGGGMGGFPGGYSHGYIGPYGYTNQGPLGFGNYGPYGGFQGVPGGPHGHGGNYGAMLDTSGGPWAGQAGSPHNIRAMSYQPGPSTDTARYPYYTTRGPRDFLMDNPPSIGN